MENETTKTLNEKGNYMGANNGPWMLFQSLTDRHRSGLNYKQMGNKGNVRHFFCLGPFLFVKVFGPEGAIFGLYNMVLVLIEIKRTLIKKIAPKLAIS